MWHMSCSTWSETDVLHMISTQLHPGHFSVWQFAVHWGIVNNPACAFQSYHYHYHYYYYYHYYYHSKHEHDPLLLACYHTLQKPASNITRQALDWNLQGKRKVGCPKQTWRRSTDAEIKTAGTTWTELKRTSQNRVRWRGVVAALCSTKNQEA